MRVRHAKLALAVVLCVPALDAQIALFSFDGSTESAVGATYSYGTVSGGDVKDVRFRARNGGTSSVDITTLTISGSGFSRSALNGVVPSTLAPGNFLEFTIRFSAGLPAQYSANLQVNGISVLLLATSVPAPVLTIFKPCLPGANGEIDLPGIAIGSSGGCEFTLQNQSSQNMVISTLAVTGDPAFQGPANLTMPATLKPNDAITFSIQFKPVCGQLDYAASLNVNGRISPLAGIGLTPPLPTPLLSFDTNTLASGEQHIISMTLPNPAACATTGYLNLEFAGVTQDASVFFLSGSTRALPFSVKANDTQVSINGKPSAMFQTGTTAGTLIFSLAANISGDASVRMTVAPAPITIETASASNQRTGELDVEVVGFDNTYSAGGMSFTFFDAGGKPIGPAISADFSSNFKTFYSSATAGSSFLMRVSFPVMGDQTQVAKVQVTLTNSAGQTQTGSLTFQ